MSNDDTLKETPETVMKNMSDEDLIEYLRLRSVGGTYEKAALKELVERYKWVKKKMEIAQSFCRGNDE